MTTKISKGIPLKKGQLIEVNSEDCNGIFRVKEDVEWSEDFQSWGSAWLENFYPPIFTHKGHITVLTEAPQDEAQ